MLLEIYRRTGWYVRPLFIGLECQFNSVEPATQIPIYTDLTTKHAQGGLPASATEPEPATLLKPLPDLSQRIKAESDETEAVPRKRSRTQETHAEWLPEHQLILARAIQKLVMQQRTSLYTEPGLEAFRAHGSSKLGMKVQQMMDSFDKANGGDGTVAKQYAKAARTGK